ncbi:hypothetical protein PVAP13_8NG045101 [Panicum virgatum]|uniref:Uncharacterized protein n=1 Tax=Panicum virgatum TaxID=38727 RepID=A0A8T0P583_PANVG|nr:hypothetical protein PVAP13_8NG045101 [Panicum virgatum]
MMHHQHYPDLAHLRHVPAESISVLFSHEPVRKRQQARKNLAKNRSLTFWFALAGHHHYSSSVSVSLGSLFCCGWRCVGRMPELPFLLFLLHAVVCAGLFGSRDFGLHC